MRTITIEMASGAVSRDKEIQEHDAADKVFASWAAQMKGWSGFQATLTMREDGRMIRQEVFQ